MILQMKLYVDTREKKLNLLLIAFNTPDEGNASKPSSKPSSKSSSKPSPLTIETKKLDLGDLVLCGDNDELLLLFERKSISDLASSVQDGRYREQSSRLCNSSIENHNIIYIIEGNIERVHPSARINKDALKSCVVSLNLHKGFSVLKTAAIDDTARWVLAYCYKIGKDAGLRHKLQCPCPIQSKDDTTNGDAPCDGDSENGDLEHLGHLSKQAKSKYVTKDNIQILMLSLIPYVSAAIAEAVLKKYTTIEKLIADLREDENCLSDVKIINKGTNKERKLPKNVVNNIKAFLL